MGADLGTTLCVDTADCCNDFACMGPYLQRFGKDSKRERHSPASVCTGPRDPGASALGDPTPRREPQPGGADGLG